MLIMEIVGGLSTGYQNTRAKKAFVFVSNQKMIEF